MRRFVSSLLLIYGMAAGGAALVPSSWKKDINSGTGGRTLATLLAALLATDAHHAVLTYLRAHRIALRAIALSSFARHRQWAGLAAARYSGISAQDISIKTAPAVSHSRQHVTVARDSSAIHRQNDVFEQRLYGSSAGRTPRYGGVADVQRNLFDSSPQHS